MYMRGAWAFAFIAGFGFGRREALASRGFRLRPIFFFRPVEIGGRVYVPRFFTENPLLRFHWKYEKAISLYMMVIHGYT
jgi:hypothetical protein